ncbi:hypothetical protein Leryth_019085 [Lithospermum erythrorhizon]|nr:hypothetical protein Leryth_019085 [Lithospermum erythrorhizon]
MQIEGALTPLGFLERAALVYPNRKSIVYNSVEFTWQQTYQRCKISQLIIVLV